MNSINNNIITSLQMCWEANANIELARDLELWVQEVRGTIEYPQRQEAAKRIIHCAQYQEESLDLSNLGLTTLPDAIGSLVALKELKLQLNKLTILPDAIGNLTALEVLDLFLNQLTTLPDAIGRLVALKKLHLAANQITMLPNTIGNLVALQVLDLQENRLTTLPDTIGNLIAVEDLPLYKNQLTTLPDTIGGLIALKVLYLSQNRLTTLPLALAQRLSCVSTIFIDGNCFSPETIRAFQNVIEETKRSNPLLGPSFIQLYF